jgi:hypothetical protein
MDNLDKVHVNWALDIFHKMEEILKSTDRPDEKLAAIEYLVKQGLKIEREND